MNVFKPYVLYTSKEILSFQLILDSSYKQISFMKLKKKSKICKICSQESITFFVCQDRERPRCLVQFLKYDHYLNTDKTRPLR